MRRHCLYFYGEVLCLPFTFMALNIFAADDIIFYYYFSEKIRLDI